MEKCITLAVFRMFFVFFPMVNKQKYLEMSQIWFSMQDPVLLKYNLNRFNVLVLESIYTIEQQLVYRPSEI